MKVLLVVIDAATPRVVCPAIRTGRLPVLARLADAGGMHEGSISIFPSITPAATTSIITGAYPSEHGIAGASWFDTARQEVAYYGDDFWVIAREGFGQFVRDFLLRLNGDRLKAPTMFEMVEQSGRTAASVNYLVFRGRHPHRARIPGLMAALPGVSLSEVIEGPSVLYLGDFVGTPTPDGRTVEGKGGVLHRFGMDDESTGALLRDLFSGERPDFTVAYFADNDYRSHEVGPHASLPVVERVDQMLGEAFEAAGGLEHLLADTYVIVTSDHGHCENLSTPSRAIVRLDELLGNFRQAALGRPWQEGEQVLICPNMRAAQIYVRESILIEDIAREVLQDGRLDQVMWRTSHTKPGADGYTVLTSRGRLEFTRESGSRTFADAFGGRWSFRGEADTLGLQVDGETLEFDQYPNAFERIAGALDLGESGEIWVTARPGCEFEVPGGKAHVGGASHGALHALDSLSPVIIAGGATRPRLPRHMRLVDLAPLCMDLLGLPMRYRPGAPRGLHALSPASPTR
ncbi:hypothetical protein BH24ACI4_BH24ACI4_07100 [soil metagenome]